ncbi:putative membrane protein [Desulfitobacterium sp. LBE]|nr:MULTISPECIES: SMR family transporter [Desulfitobacterium]ACL21745.1 transporter protein [Desulfitobacterium hafniense DCB-2]KTE90243.1 transporter [Desulfitobacterium hafniense]MEA5024688.1 SMR family transporter [Desulfitobacterium hafniense]TWH60482.1 putative membrane protein [Desulfitobacterium sp. LBE]CDX02662.1 Transporter protein [Desulfitobacterium hafniense]
MLGQIIISVILGAFGQILVKIGAKNLELDFAPENLLRSLGAIMQNFPVMSGLFLYGVSFILWIKVLTKTELSYAYPFVSLGYIFIMAFSVMVFKENISFYRVLGTVLVIVGVIFISRS